MSQADEDKRNGHLQAKLRDEQLAEFNHADFVQGQIRAFQALTSQLECAEGSSCEAMILDVGGGHGLFASALNGHGYKAVRVIDTDPCAIVACKEQGVDAVCGDILAKNVHLNGYYLCLNLILHHLVGRNERDNVVFQKSALGEWRGRFRYVFVNEYIYESPIIDGLSSWLIWLITSSRILSAIARTLTVVIPSLRANTFGVGVRFRSLRGWRKLFAECRLEEVGYLSGKPERISLARRLLFISSCRRDYFLLQVEGQ